MNWMGLTLCVLMHTPTSDPLQQPQTLPSGLPVSVNATTAAAPSPANGSAITIPSASLEGPAQTGCMDALALEQHRKAFLSDTSFPDFIGPITNPILSKDPRSNTFARFLFINNVIPASNALAGGDFQVYALQVNIALTERLNFIADKDGIASLNPNGLPGRTGFLNIAAGLKYTFLRDVENQTLGAVGFLYEAPTGESKVFQGDGDGVMTIFGTFGQEFANKAHFLMTTGFQFPFNRSFNSTMFYASAHLDKQLFGWLYPLVELNYFYYAAGADTLPAGVGEGDGLLNLGTSGVAGNSLLFGAVGLKAILSEHLQAGVAYEFPITKTRDLLESRITAELILRY